MNRASDAERRPRVMIVDDDPTQADTLSMVLDLEGFEVQSFNDPRTALAAIRQHSPDAVISDFKMPGLTGVELFHRVREADLDPLFIVITAFGTLETAVDAMRAGVDDFLTKPVDTDELILKLKKALRLRVLESENTALKRAVAALQEQVRIVGDSEPMQRVLGTVEQVSASHATVLIHGESGTGKELVARAIHLRSPRQTGPYVKVNCAAIPDTLLEDALFGHVAGAFTGAVGDRRGKFDLADGGTIFLDEIGELPLHLQPKLLRVIQEREVEPVGAGEAHEVDVRLIAATHRDLQQMVADGEFREDLYYRLNVIPIPIPPLRERGGDVLELADHFLRRFCEENNRKLDGFTREAKEKLRTYSWPGNVRELENCIERAVVLCPQEQVDAGDLLLSGPRREETSGAVVQDLFDSDLTLDELERNIITRSLERCGGNLSRTARILGLTRRALQYRVEKIRREAARDPETEPGTPSEGDG